MLVENGIELVEVPFTRHRAFDEQIVQMVAATGLTPILLADAEGEFSVSERRKQYGGQFPLRGGMETQVLLQGAQAIDEMIEKVFTEAAAGGYLPTLLDRYGLFLEVPLKSYAYYTRAFRKANGVE